MEPSQKYGRHPIWSRIGRIGYRRWGHLPLFLGVSVFTAASVAMVGAQLSASDGNPDPRIALPVSDLTGGKDSRCSRAAAATAHETP